MKMMLSLLACLAFSAIGCSIEPPAEPAIKPIEIPKTAHSAEADPCVRYQKEALRYLERMESSSNGTQQRSRAAVSVAYSGYYLVCRDLEKRK